MNTRLQEPIPSTAPCSTSGSSSDEWETPQELFNLLDGEFDFDFDAAASAETSKVYGNYFGPDHQDPSCRNCLTADWTHPEVEASIWLNPPYSKPGPFLAKAIEEKDKGAGATIVTLLPVCTDVGWWWDYVLKAHEIRFLKGRLKFLMDGKPQSTARFSSAVVIYRPGRIAHGFFGQRPLVHQWWDWKRSNLDAAK